MNKRSKSCRGKYRHPNSGKAEAAARSLLRLEPDGKFSVYYCAFCHSWHVGHRNTEFLSKYAKDSK